MGLEERGVRERERHELGAEAANLVRELPGEVILHAVVGELVEDQLVVLLADGPIEPSFAEAADVERQPVPAGQTSGGHAMIVVGYLSGVGFIVKNSWGIGWGDAGYCIMTPEYLAWSETGDLWVPTKGSEFR